MDLTHHSCCIARDAALIQKIKMQQSDIVFLTIPDYTVSFAIDSDSQKNASALIVAMPGTSQKSMRPSKGKTNPSQYPGTLKDSICTRCKKPVNHMTREQQDQHEINCKAQSKLF